MIMTEIEWERYIGKVMHKVGTKNLIGQCSWVVLRSIKAFTIIIVGTYARLFGIRQ